MINAEGRFNHEVNCRVCIDHRPSELFMNLSGNSSLKKAGYCSSEVRGDSAAQWNLTILLPKDLSLQFRSWRRVCQIEWWRKNVMIWTELNNSTSTVTGITEILKMRRVQTGSCWTYNQNSVWYPIFHSKELMRPSTEVYCRIFAM
jgi:hypothetical protein